MKEPTPKQTKHFYSFGPFRLFLAERELFRGGEPVTLPPKTFDTLLLLLYRHGHVVDKDELMKTLWPETFVEEDSLVQQISHLRKALGKRPDGGPYIETIARRGYRFSADVTDSWEEEPAESELAVAGPSHPEARPAGRRRRLAWLLGAVCILAAGVTGWLLSLRPGPSAPEAVLRVVPVTSYLGRETYPSFSPDGRQVAFSWNGEKRDNFDIYVKLLDAGPPDRLTTDPADDLCPAWSPDGRRIAFYRRTQDGVAIYSVSSRGGSQRTLTDVRFLDHPWREGHRLSWSPDGRFLAFEDKESPEGRYGIFLLSVATREKQRVPIIALESLDLLGPAFSPDGQTLAFFGTAGVNLGDFYVASVGGGEAKRLTFDGEPTGGLAWTADGREIVFSSARSGGLSLWRISAAGGTPEHLGALGGGALLPAISRQGGRLLYVQQVGDANIWRFDARGRSAPTRLIASTKFDGGPQYSPDGNRILFCSNRSGKSELWLCDSDGLNPVQLTFFGGSTRNGSPSWSPDGKQIAFDSNFKGDWDICVIDAGGGAPRPLTTDSSADARPSWSRDGRWVYFTSTRTGTNQVWKVPAGGGSPIQVTRRGGNNPVESTDGKFVYYSKATIPPSIWRVPAEGGEEAPVLEHYSRADYGNWVPVDDGIYFATWEGGSGSIKF
ncbi:MAG: LpqB family beta-propeller domain-containing protein, partial [Candidatus Hodarchaeota archaeon]